MTVGELKALISELDDAMEVWLSVDCRPHVRESEYHSCQMAVSVEEYKSHIVINDAEVEL